MTMARIESRKDIRKGAGNVLTQDCDVRVINEDKMGEE
jgi:hypothetical protein